MRGLTTIGNATLIAYDEKPILVTDPWLGEEDLAYFGSWCLTHFIPSQQKQEILKAEYAWMSHYHPDHLNPQSIQKFKNKTILLGDHAGQRLAKGLTEDGFKVQILKDKTWVKLSKILKFYVLPIIYRILFYWWMSMEDCSSTLMIAEHVGTWVLLKISPSNMMSPTC